MSAIVSLLRVMSLRDAEALTLEANKVPSLRRRGNVEAMSMPAIEPRLLEDFIGPLVAGKSLDDGPLMVSFADDEGTTYPITIERAASGLRVVARKGAAKAPAAKPKPPVAEPSPRPPAVSIATPVAAPDVEIEHVAIRDRLAHLLAAPIAVGHARGASDVFVSTGQQTRARVDGRLEPIEASVDDDELQACVTALGGTADLSIEVGEVRVRLGAFEHVNGAAIAARIIRDRVPSLTELALPAELGPIVEQRDGLVLVCGPTGSGKSTTLASLIDLLDQRIAAHVITLEDPIEYRFTARRCLIHQRELGLHFPTFARGLRAALRESPDVILLGELRDPETIAAALTAAETGHLVLATLHAPNAAGAIDRIIDAFPETAQRQIRTQLAQVLRTVITQFLLPRRDGGRAPAIELVPVTNAVSNIIRKGDLHTLPTAIQSGREAGMIPLEKSLAKLLDAGVVSPQAVKRIAADQDLLAALAGRLR
ncbi:MAG TPA: PilT/PilU family type 4a pilus ATPase [Kofleriaceae bacterium]|jgi:twitching motility protein PilT|nr:PilT/PilU family type 4a pilus ATPase [Kofleriaceae bacterium]